MCPPPPEPPAFAGSWQVLPPAPPPPPADVIVLNTELLPSSPFVYGGEPDPVDPPAPTVIGYVCAVIVKPEHGVAAKGLAV